MRHSIGTLAGVIALPAILLIPASASAQPAPASVGSTLPATASWRVEVGLGTVAIRDIARTGTPMDASPVAWTGDARSLFVRHARPGGRHRVEFTAAQASRFALKTPLESRNRPSGDAFSRLEARYEYRRYLFSNLLVRGLDIGAGLQGGGTRTHISRHLDGGLEISESRLAFRTAFVAALRFRQGSRFGLEVNWANGAHLDHASERHSAVTGSGTSRSGGGWVTDLVAAADVALSSDVSIALQYVRTEEWTLSSRRHFTTARRSWNVGVIYAK